MTCILMATPGSGATFFRHFLELCYGSNYLDCNKAAIKIEEFFETELLAHHICLAAEGIISNTDYKIIHLIRNPLDTINSRIIRNHRPDHVLELKTLTKLNLLDEKLHIQFANIWKKDIETATKLRGNKRYLELRYEDFVNRPEETVLIIEEFLGQTNTQSIQYLKDSLKPSIDKHKNIPEDIINEIKNITKKVKI